jgi:hypothetical protein
MAEIEVRQRTTHQVGIGVIADGGRKYVNCTFSVGGKDYSVHGPASGHPAHPPMRLSVSNQDDVVWSSAHRFRIDFKDPRPDDLFFRPLPWKSVKGLDDVHRVHSGALDPKSLPALRKAKRTIEFIAMKLVDDTDDVSEIEDEDVTRLDPHFIVEP